MNTNNLITISGEVASNPEECLLFGKEYFKFDVKTNRPSGVSDLVPCMTEKEKVGHLQPGDKIKGLGTIKTQNIDKKLIIRVYLETISDYEGVDYDRVLLDGFICKKNVRKTTLSKMDIADVILAVNRSDEVESDYIPLVVWGKSALRLDKYEIGTRLLINGRLQSREYEKEYENGTAEIKIAYEVSALCTDLITNKQGE